MQLGRIIRRRRELFQHFPPHSSCRLLHPHYGRVPEITFYEEHHLFIAHEHIVAADGSQPSLYRGLDSCLVFICTDTSGGLSGRYSWNESFRVGGY